MLSARDGALALAVVGHAGPVERARLTLEADEPLRWHLTPVHASCATTERAHRECTPTRPDGPFGSLSGRDRRSTSGAAAIDDQPVAEIVRRDRDAHLVAGQHADVVPAHAP